MFKIIVNLLANGAGKKRWQIEIGTYLLKKGCGFQVGQIIQEKRIHPGLWKVKIISGMFYDFRKNEITHTTENRVVKNEK